MTRNGESGLGGVTFAERLRQAREMWGPLCVGIDPHPVLLDDWGLDVSASGAREFGLRVVEAVAGQAGVVKPQVAFFERFGSAGFAALEDVLRAARNAGLIVIADAKRGDIGSTMAGYAQAWLGSGSPLESDALTVSPYLGAKSLNTTIETALEAGKGLFILAATSNPEAIALQSQRDAAGRSIAQQVVDDVASSGAAGSVGVVVGATVDRAGGGLDDRSLSGIPILAPGFGFQGVAPEALPTVFGELTRSVLPSESRSILQAGPEQIATLVATRARQYREVCCV